MKLKELNSYEKLQNVITQKKENEGNFINDSFNDKKEKIMNHVYDLSILRDKHLDKISALILQKEERITKETQDLQFKLDDNQINLEQYENEKNSKLKNCLEKLRKDILDLQGKLEIRRTKWDKIINKKRVVLKSKISKIDTRNQQIIHKLDETFEKINHNVELESEKYSENDKSELSKLESKVQNSKINKQLERLKIKFESKGIGPLSYKNEVTKISEKKELLIDDINKNYKPKSFTKGKRKLTKNTVFSFSNRSKISNKIMFGLDQSKLIIVIMLIAVVVGILQPVFFSSRNWKLIFLQNADLLCLAVGVTIVILTGGIDLSIGSTLAFASGLIAKLILDGYSIYLAIGVLIGFCLLAGLASGVLVAWLKLPPFIVTLVMMLIWRGATYVLLENKVIPVQNDLLIKISSLEIIGIPLPVILAMTLVIITFIILKFTVYGRSIYAVGGNYKASELSGVKSKIILASVYVTASLCFALGSLLYISRIRVATPTTGNAWELDAIACVVLGGTALTGGKGGIVQTLMGWFVMSVLKNALVIVGLDTNVQSIVKGIVILVAILSQSNYGIIKYLSKKVKVIKYKIMTI